MARREDMILARLRQGLSVVDMAIKCKTTRRIISMLEDEDCTVTHPSIAARVGKAYGMGAKEIEMLMPDNYRGAAPTMTLTDTDVRTSLTCRREGHRKLCMQSD